MRSDPAEETGAPPQPRVEDRVVALLGERSGAFAFSGLRRTLRVHPESLSRALRRLERYGLVERAAGGYRLASAPAEENDPVAPPGGPIPPRGVPVAELSLAPGFDSAQLLGSLAGRWAGHLRWVGMYDQPGEPRLVWSRTDGPGHVLVGVTQGRLRIYAEPVPPGPVPSDLHAAAQELLSFALERLRFATRPGANLAGVTTFVLGESVRPATPN